MLEQLVEKAILLIIPICELMGITVVIISILQAFKNYLLSLITKKEIDIKFQLANGLALCLEFKMAAEILKTVLIRELKELIVLGAVIILRALLSLLIHFEMKQDGKEKFDKKNYFLK